MLWNQWAIAVHVKKTIRLAIIAGWMRWQPYFALTLVFFAAGFWRFAWLVVLVVFRLGGITRVCRNERGEEIERERKERERLWTQRVKYKRLRKRDRGRTPRLCVFLFCVSTFHNELQSTTRIPISLHYTHLSAFNDRTKGTRVLWQDVCSLSTIERDTPVYWYQFSSEKAAWTPYEPNAAQGIDMKNHV